MTIQRSQFLSRIRAEYDAHQVCALTGPRQCGKTWLSKAYSNEIKGEVHWFDCENPLHIARLDSPMLALQDLKGLIVIDEVQLRPDLFPVIRVLVDSDPERRFLITGSASRDLLHQSSESLAGRIGYIEVTPFSLMEVSDYMKLWVFGGFPKSFLTDSHRTSEHWRSQYIKSFLERDLRNLGFDISPIKMGQLWRMLSIWHGQVLNINELSKSLMLDSRTISRYLDILEGAFMIRRLRPFHTNAGLREVKSSKVYIRDSGILHSLLGLTSSNVSFNPRLGSSFEGFAIEEILRLAQTPEEVYFWGVHSGGELDLLIIKDAKKIGFEIKHTDSPRVTKSMRSAIENLGLDHLYLVIPQKETFRMDEKITCIGIKNLDKIDQFH